MGHDEGGHAQPPLAVEVGLQALQHSAGGGPAGGWVGAGGELERLVWSGWPGAATAAPERLGVGRQVRAERPLGPLLGRARRGAQRVTRPAGTPPTTTTTTTHTHTHLHRRHAVHVLGVGAAARAGRQAVDGDLPASRDGRGSEGEETRGGGASPPTLASWACRQRGELAPQPQGPALHACARPGMHALATQPCHPHPPPNPRRSGLERTRRAGPPRTGTRPACTSSTGTTGRPGGRGAACSRFPARSSRTCRAAAGQGGMKGEEGRQTGRRQPDSTPGWRSAVRRITPGAPRAAPAMAPSNNSRRATIQRQHGGRCSQEAQLRQGIAHQV